MVKEIIPLVRLDCSNGIKLAEAINPPVMVIPIYDLILKSNAKPNKKFKDIKKSGGIHNFLGYDGIVILSLIMNDGVIWKSSPEQYAEIIKGISPNAYTTVDGATYDKKDLKSFKEMLRLSKETKELLKLCPNVKPIGHIKGCNSAQIRLHLNYFKKLGINTFLFHAGDFLRDGNKSMIQKAKHFCSLIKKEDNTLLVYGLGSPKRMLEFSFCDLFITYTHFVNAKHGKIFAGTKKKKYSNMSIYEAAKYNFKEISSYLKNLKHQTKLFTGGKKRWVEELQEPQLAMQNQRTKK